MESEDMLLTVGDIRKEARDIVSIILEAPAGKSLPKWSPGSHIDVVTPEGLVAQYSLCGAAIDEHWRIAVLHHPEGRGVSNFLHTMLKIGDHLRVAGPRNHFQLVDASSYCFIGGGIGITPLLPMIASVDGMKPWRLFYGGRTRQSMALLRELEPFGVNVAIVPEDEEGLLPVEAILDATEVDTAVYCCGPEPLIQAVENSAQARRRSAPHVERFSPREILRGEDDRPFEVVLSRCGRVLTVPADRSVLDVVSDAGVFVPSSCHEGTCGSCETTVLEGEVLHRDSILSEDDRKAGSSMMICVSRARSRRLILDL